MAALPKEDGCILQAIDKAAKHLGYDKLKELQWKVMKEVIKGNDVFAVLPTGFGKSVLRVFAFGI